MLSLFRFDLNPSGLFSNISGRRPYLINAALGLKANISEWGCARIQHDIFPAKGRNHLHFKPVTSRWDLIDDAAIEVIVNPVGIGQ